MSEHRATCEASDPPLAFFPPDLALTISPAAWRALFAAFGAPEGFAAASCDAPSGFARALFGARVSPALAEALHVLERFASPLARSYLREAARDVGLDVEGTPRDATPGDLAAHFVVARARDASLTASIDGVFDRAAIRLARLGPPRATYELRARAPRRVSRPDACVAPLRALLASRAAERGTPAFVDAWLVVEDERVHVAAMHAAPRESVATLAGRSVADGAAADQADALDATSFTPLACDLLRLDVPEGRLRITASDPSLVRAYAETLGRALYDDPLLFDDRPSFTLRPLLALGAEGVAKAKLSPPATRARLVSVTLDTGAEAHLELHGPDALASLAAHVHAGGYLTKAVVRIDIAGARGPVDVRFALPTRVTFSHDGRSLTQPGLPSVEHEAAARAACEALDLFAPGKLGDTLHSLAPWKHQEWRWREVLGDAEVERLTESAILVREAESRSVTGKDVRAHGRSILTSALPHEAGKRYAWSDDPSVPARTVASDATAALRLDLPKLAERIGVELGLAPGTAKAMKKSDAAELAADGAFLVGSLVTKSASLVFFLLARLPSDGERARVGKRLARAAAPGHAVVLAPEEIAFGPGIVVTELTGVRAPEGAVAAAAKELNVLDEVEPWRLAPEGTELVIDRAKETAHWKGCALKLSPNNYKLLLFLAERAGEYVESKAIGAHVVKGGDDRTLHAARPRLLREVTASFVAAGKPVPKALELLLVKGTRGTFALGVKAWVR